MTDIRKAVKRYSESRNENGIGFSNGLFPDEKGGFVSYDDYAALSARVEEFEKAEALSEAMTDRLNKAEVDRDSAFEDGRLQGLDEAVEKLRRILGPNSAITARIKALKEQSND